MRQTRYSFLPLVALSLLVSTGCISPKSASRSPDAAVNWKPILQDEIPRLGHRNWIVIADSAYPLQSRQGILTVYTGGDHLEVLNGVLAELKKSGHAQPIVWTDAELPKVPEADAPGVSAFRQKLDRALAGQDRRSKPHMEIIKSLDEAAQLFSVVVIKTDLKIPYTTVFLELDCAYWDGKKEARMREAGAPR